MKYFHLVWAGLFRKKARTVLTLLSVVVAFLLFGLLQAVNDAFSAGAEQARADRLITNSRYSIIEMLPIGYLPQIESVPGVKEVAFASWFGGSYQDRPAQFGVFPVDPERYLRTVPEIVLPPEQLERWRETRDGAIVGRSLAERYGGQVGDRVRVGKAFERDADRLRPFRSRDGKGEKKAGERKSGAVQHGTSRFGRVASA